MRHRSFGWDTRKLERDLNLPASPAHITNRGPSSHLRISHPVPLLRFGSAETALMTAICARIKEMWSSPHSCSSILSCPSADLAGLDLSHCSKTGGCTAWRKHCGRDCHPWVVYACLGIPHVDLDDVRNVRQFYVCYERWFVQTVLASLMAVMTRALRVDKVHVSPSTGTHTQDFPSKYGTYPYCRLRKDNNDN